MKQASRPIERAARRAHAAQARTFRRQTVSGQGIKAQAVSARLHRLRDEQRARILQRFFKTGRGEYAEGDIFLGIQVPQLRKTAKECQHLSIGEVIPLLRSSVHEERLLALLILVRAYEKGEKSQKREIYEFYLSNARFVNHWDLVDASAPHIVGAFLMDKSKTPLYLLAKSSSLWKRRISIMSTLYFIRKGIFSETLRIAKMLISDKEDLVHKAVGWMLREVGKRHRQTEEDFLKAHYKRMPRTMLRYAIEKFPASRKTKYLNSAV